MSECVGEAPRGCGGHTWWLKDSPGEAKRMLRFQVHRFNLLKKQTPSLGCTTKEVQALCAIHCLMHSRSMRCPTKLPIVDTQKHTHTHTYKMVLVQYSLSYKCIQLLINVEYMSLRYSHFVLL